MVTLREALKGKLTAGEFKQLRGSFDVVGDIAIVEVPLSLKAKKKMIAETLQGLLKNVRVVAVKAGAHTGKYRRQKLEVVVGDKSLETVQKESGVALKLDVEKCYYSLRLGSERLRIASLIKSGERVLVGGSGVGVYPLVIAKHSSAGEIVGVEVNPVAHKYALENVALNKVNNVTFFKSDVRKLDVGVFDRVILAIPHMGVSFVPALLKCVKKGAFMHVLDFADEADLDAPAQKIVELCKEAGRECAVIGVVKAGQHGVRKYRICVDVRVN